MHMKNGTFVIIDKEGKKVAAILRADGQYVYLDGLTLTDDLLNYDGKSCQYMVKGNSKVVNINGKNIYKQQRLIIEKSQPQTSQKRTDLRQQMLKNVDKVEHETIENVEKPAWSRTDSLSLKLSCIPSDTKSLSLRGPQVDNFNLKLNKLARFEQSFNEKKGEWDRKFSFIKGGSYQIQANFGNLFSNNSQLSNRILTSAQALFSLKGQLIQAQFKPEWRFVTGLGGHSVYETGITLHHIYGVPYIPASSIKGVLRSWIIYKQFGNNDQGKEDLKNAEKRALQCKDFCHLFGCPAESIMKKAYQGRITFFDALPTKKPTIEPDIMNPHYPKWYGVDGRAPVDTENPVPIFFLTVKETPFLFIMGTKPKQGEEEWNLNDNQFWGKTIMEWLTDALSEHGLGAKTAVGYGYFKPTT
ncbi:MAG: type III-B CRISPR module RAMP protein Cmr6 [Bacteroidetes bacterium]|nr:MAG: type III-B CRISPR module RAMP protein Cmr6 [Bacteroidota bacterium]